MKNQNPNNKLAFKKADVAELNETQLQEVLGGASLVSILPTIVITFV